MCWQKNKSSKCRGKDGDQCSAKIMGTVDGRGWENVKQLFEGYHLYGKTCVDLYRGFFFCPQHHFFGVW